MDKNHWIYCAPKGEPPFWARRAEPHEIDGLDPLTGFILAFTDDERERRSLARKP